jgi:hypothetical protein
MRKLMVGLLVVGLLAAAGPAMAQSFNHCAFFNGNSSCTGWGDPLALLATGAVLPYFGSGTGAIEDGSISFLEVYAPNFAPSSVHMFFFDRNCTRQGESFNLPVSQNDVEILPLHPDFIGASAPVDGLVTLAGTDGGGFILVPLDAPLHAKVLWINVGSNEFRTLDPITLATFDDAPALIWNTLRTGATFFAPNVSGITTQLFFICPNDNIQSKSTTSHAAAFPRVDGFPVFITSNNGDGFQTAGATTPLRLRIFDDEESFLRDASTTCNCLTKTQVTTISNVFTNHVLAPNGTYTEIEGGTVGSTSCDPDPTHAVPATTSNPCNCVDSACVDSGGTAGFKFKLIQAAHASPFAFTGYRAITFGSGSSQASLFGRLNGANACDLDPESPSLFCNTAADPIR